MFDELKNFAENIDYIPLSEAAEVLNTSRDYMNVLVRRGKLRAVKLGRNWFTTDEWLSEYQLSVGKNRAGFNASKLEQEEKAELAYLRDASLAERLKRVESQFENFQTFRDREIFKKVSTSVTSHEIKLPSRPLKSGERNEILERVRNNFKAIDSSAFQKVAKRSGILRSLKKFSNFRLAMASAAVAVLIAATIGLASGLVNLQFPHHGNLEASILSDIFHGFPTDIPDFFSWLKDKSIALFKTRSLYELAIGPLESGKPKIVQPKESYPSISTLAEAEALDLPSEALAKEGETGVSGIPVSTGEFTLIENRLSALEDVVVDQIALVKAELMVQKQTILALAKLVPIHPISTIVVQGQPATLTSYSVQPQVNTGFDRLSANYLLLSNNAEINGSLTVKSGGIFNSLSVSGVGSLGSLSVSGLSSLATLNVSGDSTLNNLALTGTLNAGTSNVIFANASTTNLTVSGNAWVTNSVIINGTITNASTTYATLPTFWSTNGTITNASTTYLTVGSSAFFPGSGIWNSSGNVGIGTSTGLFAKLTVDGGGSDSTTAALSVVNSASTSLLFIRNDGFIGISTTTQALAGYGVNIATSTSVYGNFYVSGNSTVIGGSTSDTLTIISKINSDLIPDGNSTRDLGSTSYYWKNAYISTLTMNSASAASTTIGGTQSETFTINSDNATSDNETETLIFFVGTVPPNAKLTWNAATSSKRFEFNQVVYINNESASTTNPTFTVKTIASQTANALQVLNSSDSTIFSVNPVSSNTTMVNASTTNLSVSGNLWTDASSFLTIGGSLLLPDGTVSNPSLAFTNSPNSGIYRSGADQISFTTASANALTIKSNQYVGIGNTVTNPQTQLEVGERDGFQNTITDVLRLDHYSTASAMNGFGTGILFYGQNSLGEGKNMARIASQIEQATSTDPGGFLANLSFYTVGSTGLLEKMRITGNGQLALATTTVPSGYGANIATSTYIYGDLTVSGNSIFNNSSTTNATLTNLWSTNGNITNASTTYATLPTFWSSNANITGGSVTGITDLTVADGGTGASTLTGLLQGNGTSAITGVTGTAGQFPYFNGTNTLLATSTIFVSTTGNVGIGTTGPEQLLHVNGASPRIRISDTGTSMSAIDMVTNTAAQRTTIGTERAAGGGLFVGSSAYASVFGSAGASVTQFASNNNVRMTIDTSGNVGIGTTNPGYKLTVKGAGSHSGLDYNSIITVQDTAASAAGMGGGINFVGNYTGAGGDTMLDIGSGIRGVKHNGAILNDYNWDLAFWTRNSDNATITEKMRILYNGNVGIGTTNPSLGHLVISDTTGTPLYVDNTSGNGYIRLNRAATTQDMTLTWQDANVDKWYLGQRNADGVNSFHLYSTAKTGGAGDVMTVLNTGNVGIGTTNPGGKLDVAGSFVLSASGGTPNGPSFSNYTPGNQLLIAGGTAGTLIQNQNQTVTLVTVLNGGNVGIGTTNPGGKLDVAGSFVLSASGGTPNGPSFSNYTPGNQLLIAGGTAGTLIQNQNQTVTLVTVLNGGNVGIGTTGPGSKLTVNGNVQFGSDASIGDVVISRPATRQIRFESGPTTGSGNGITVNVGNPTDSGTNFIVNGNVGIGTTNPGAKLQVGSGVNAVLSDGTIRVGAGDGGGGFMTWDFGVSAANSFNYFIKSRDIATPSLVIKYDSGNVGIGTTNPNQGIVEVKGGTVCVDTNSDDNATSCIASESDIRLKENIVEITGALDKVLSLRGVSFDWRVNDPGVLSHYPLISRFASRPHSVGLVAQEVQPILPEAISLETVGDKEVQYLQLDYERFTPLIIEAIKEMNAKIDNIATSTLTAKQGTIDLTTLNSDLNLNGFAILNVKSISGLNGLWKIDENGNLTVQSVNTQALTVGGGNASGVTVYDRGTTQPKCVYVENDVIKISAGACGATQNSGTPAVIETASAAVAPMVATSTTEILPTATSTTEITIPALEPIATTTEPVIVSEMVTTTTATSTP